MYTKVDLIENEKMNKIIKENQKKIREMDKKNAKQQKILNIILTISAGVFFVGLMYLIAVIESMRF